MLWRNVTCALIAGTLGSSLALADFMPPNDLWKEDGLFRAAGGISETEFNEVIDSVEFVYKPIVATLGGTLKVNRLWTNTTVNASATQSGRTWEVNMYGGLARRPEITRDGFTIVLCHELGHHLGGYPFSSSWAGNEGSADYFATLSCARKLWADEPDTNASYRGTIDPIATAACDKAWTNTDDRDLCYRVAAAGKSTADLLSALGGTQVSFGTPDTKEVSTTFNSHPQGQCRLDTYLAGALCEKLWDLDLIPGKALGSRRNSAEAEQESVPVSCTQSEGYKAAYRPRCWFKPFLAASTPTPTPTRLLIRSQNRRRIQILNQHQTPHLRRHRTHHHPACAIILGR